MLTLAIQPRQFPAVPAASGRAKPRNPVAFLLFILVNATLFIRPADAVASLAGLPLYEMLILGCLAASLPAIAAQFTRPASRPITMMVLGLLGAVVLSHLARLGFADAATEGIEFAKMLIYFLLLVSVVDTPRRLRIFLLSLGMFIVVTTALAVLDFRGVIDLPGMSPLFDGDLDASSGQDVTFARLRAAGIFFDPNDFCQILSVGVVLCLYGVVADRGKVKRTLWLAASILLLYAVTLTHSRGGFLAVMGGIGALLFTRLGLNRSALLGLVSLPVMLAVFGGRQTEISTSSQTGQERIQLWSDALVEFKLHPLFGMGAGKFGEGEQNLVAHNTFIHEYAELGFFGGTLFVGAYYLALLGVLGLRRHERSMGDADLVRMRPFVAAAVAAYAVGLLSLSRGYDVPTYLVLGMACVYLRLVERHGGIRGARLNGKLVVHVVVASMVFLLMAHLFVNWAVRWR